MDMKTIICNFCSKIKHIQEIILQLLDEESDENFYIDQLVDYINDQNIRENRNEIKCILHLISKICNNHHRRNQFFYKIEQIIQIFQKEMKKYFSNFEIFNIFQYNKRILLFLLESGIIIVDKTVYYKLKNFSLYFKPEINKFKSLNDEQEDEEFQEKRRKGENDNYICQLIQNDSIDEFIIYVNKTNFPLSSKIQFSIFETNSFLIKNKEISLIEYATFFGSIQIFNYLRFNNVEMNSFLWLCAIHGNNAEIIHILEENQIDIHKNSYIESLKCHHINIMNYIKNQYEIKVENDIMKNFKYYNFIEFIDQIQLFENSSINAIDIFYNCCKNDYIDIVEFLLKNNTIQNINNEITTISKENDKMYTIKEFLLFHKVLHICFIKQLFMLLLKMAI